LQKFIIVSFDHGPLKSVFVQWFRLVPLCAAIYEKLKFLRGSKPLTILFENLNHMLNTILLNKLLLYGFSRISYIIPNPLFRVQGFNQNIVS
jgi:hypothetical protein